LHIGINVKEAMGLGIKFFRNKYDQVSTTGLLTGVDERELGKVPMSVFNNVFVAVVEREMMPWSMNNKQEQEQEQE